MDKEKEIKKEIARLRKIFADVPEDVLKVCEGLIVQAARHRISLDTMWSDICERGDVEQFTQSKDAPPYERQRPIANLYNARDKLYQAVIKQLIGLLPDKRERESARDELRRFNDRA